MDEHQAQGRGHEATHNLTVPLVALGVLLSLSGCGSLRPSMPSSGNTAFRTAAEAVHPAPAAKDGVTLDDVKKAFASLFASTRGDALMKHQQQWTYAEIASIGGFLAVVGHLADKIGLLNSGLGISMIGLTLNQFYDPGKTKDTHLAAEQMFMCMNSELGRVSEAKRKLALASDDVAASSSAQTAVDDVIGKVDDAIFAYRQRVLSQAASAPTRADFARFAKEYATNDQNANNQERDAAGQRSKAMLAVAQQEHRVKVARAHTEDPSITSLADADQRKRSAFGMLEAELNRLAQLRLQAAAADAAAEAKSAGAKFIPLQTNLEKCIREFRG